MGRRVVCYGGDQLRPRNRFAHLFARGCSFFLGFIVEADEVPTANANDIKSRVAGDRQYPL
jgi:hypothetical protein